MKAQYDKFSHTNYGYVTLVFTIQKCFYHINIHMFDAFFGCHCLYQEAYVVNSTEDNIKAGANSAIMPREKYPKPLVFHDGRLAFLPTPFATLSMFMWLPPGIILAIFRLFVGIFLPYKMAIFLGTLSGVRIRVKGLNHSGTEGGKKGHVLYVCTHRTLLDPVFLSTSLGKPLTAVTYSLSKMSEFIAPIRTVRLTRDRKQDGETMQRLLSEGMFFFSFRQLRVSKLEKCFEIILDSFVPKYLR